MKKYAKQLKSLFAVLVLGAVFAAFTVAAFAADGFNEEYCRVTDWTGTLTDAETEKLEDAVTELHTGKNFDAAILVINSLEEDGYGGYTLEEFADDTYDECDFGYGDNRDGVILVVSRDDREWYISTCGYGITAFTDAGIQYIGEQISEYLSDDDYMSACETFIKLVNEFVAAADNGTPYDVQNLPKEPFSWLVCFAAALGIGALMAFAVILYMRNQLESVKMQHDAADYVRRGSMNITTRRDVFLYSQVQRTEHIDDDDSSGGSSTHTSSSGSSHGGGGGHF